MGAVGRMRLEGRERMGHLGVQSEVPWTVSRRCTQVGGRRGRCGSTEPGWSTQRLGHAEEGLRSCFLAGGSVGPGVRKWGGLRLRGSMPENIHQGSLYPRTFEQLPR